MARRSDHSRDELQSMAIEATRAIISREGIEGVSARKVAHKIGYTVGTLYQAFDNINELILHANAFSLSELLRTLNQAYQKYSQPEQRLAAMAITYLQYAQNHRNHWAAIFLYSIPKDFPLPDWYQARVDALFALVENALRPLAPHSSSQQIKTASSVLWSSVHGICILHIDDKLFSNKNNSPKELINSLIHHYLQSWTRESTHR